MGTGNYKRQRRRLGISNTRKIVSQGVLFGEAKGNSKGKKDGATGGKGSKKEVLCIKICGRRKGLGGGKRKEILNAISPLIREGDQKMTKRVNDVTSLGVVKQLMSTTRLH